MQNTTGELHRALMDLVGIINRPKPDEILLEKAGVSLDRALFPLLMRVDLYGPLGVVELADLVGRDHSTVSRQVAKLEELDLIVRRPGRADKRIREAVTTKAGREMVETIGTARNRLFNEVLAEWSATERRDLTRLLRKLVDSANQHLLTAETELK